MPSLLRPGPYSRGPFTGTTQNFDPGPDALNSSDPPPRWPKQSAQEAGTFHKSLAVTSAWLGLFTSLQPTDAPVIVNQVVHTAEVRTISSASRKARVLFWVDPAAAPDAPLAGRDATFQPPESWFTQRAQNPDWLGELAPEILQDAFVQPALSPPQWAPAQEQWSARNVNIRYLADLSPPPPFWTPPNPERYATYVPPQEYTRTLLDGRWLLADLSTPPSVWSPPSPERYAQYVPPQEQPKSISNPRWLADLSTPPPFWDPPWPKRLATFWEPQTQPQAIFATRWLLDFSRTFISYDLPKRTWPMFWAPLEQPQPLNLSRWLADNYTVAPGGTQADPMMLAGARRGDRLVSIERHARYTSAAPKGDDVAQIVIPDYPLHGLRGVFVPPFEQFRNTTDARTYFSMDLLQPEQNPVLMQGMRLRAYYEPPYSFFRGVNPDLLVIGADVANPLIEFQVSQRAARVATFVPGIEQPKPIVSGLWQIQLAPPGFDLDISMLGQIRTPPFYSLERSGTYKQPMPIGPDVSNPPPAGNEAQLETLARRGWDFTPPVQEMHKSATDARIQITFAPDQEFGRGLDSQDYLPHLKEYAALGRMIPLRTAFTYPPPPDDADLTAFWRRRHHFWPAEQFFEKRARWNLSPDVANPIPATDDLVLASISHLSRYFHQPETYFKRIEFPRVVLNAPTREFIGGIGARWNYIPPGEFFKRPRNEVLLGGPVFVPQAPLLRRAFIPDFEPAVTRPVDYGRRYRVTQLDLPLPAPLGQFQIQPKRDKFVPIAQTQLTRGFSRGWLVVIGRSNVPCYRRLWLLGRLDLHDFDVKPSADTRQVRLTLEPNLGTTNVNLVGGLRIIELPEPHS